MKYQTVGSVAIMDINTVKVGIEIAIFCSIDTWILGNKMFHWEKAKIFWKWELYCEFSAQLPKLNFITSKGQ